MCFAGVWVTASYKEGKYILPKRALEHQTLEFTSQPAGLTICCVIVYNSSSVVLECGLSFSLSAASSLLPLVGSNSLATVRIFPMKHFRPDCQRCWAHTTQLKVTGRCRSSAPLQISPDLLSICLDALFWMHILCYNPRPSTHCTLHNVKIHTFSLMHWC